MNKTKQRIKELEDERERLRKITNSHSVSIWKFWQDKKDRELLRAYNKLIDLNNQRRATKQTLKEVEEVVEKLYFTIEDGGYIDVVDIKELKKELGLEAKEDE